LIVLDTHIWIWWVHDHSSLKQWMRDRIRAEEPGGMAISAISCWEIAQLVALKRLDLNRPIDTWFADALAYPGIDLAALTPQISIDSNNLPGEFHKDPADRIIVATARVLNCDLLTADGRILAYPDVRIAKPPP
jgi:PIN domain nuclease of toxin-antitoxin system